MGVLVSLGYYNKNTIGDINRKYLLITVLEARSPRSRCQQDLVPGESLPSCSALTWPFLGAYLWRESSGLSSLPYRDTSPAASELYPKDFI